MNEWIQGLMAAQGTKTKWWLRAILNKDIYIILLKPQQHCVRSAQTMKSWNTGEKHMKFLLGTTQPLQQWTQCSHLVVLGLYKIVLSTITYGSERAPYSWTCDYWWVIIKEKPLALFILPLVSQLASNEWHQTHGHKCPWLDSVCHKTKQGKKWQLKIHLSGLWPLQPRTVG